MKKEEIIRALCIKWDMNTIMGNVLAIEAWNWAVNEAAKQACTDCHCVEGHCNGVDKESITDLIFEI